MCKWIVWDLYMYKTCMCLTLLQQVTNYSWTMKVAEETYFSRKFIPCVRTSSDLLVMNRRQYNNHSSNNLSWLRLLYILTCLFQNLMKALIHFSWILFNIYYSPFIIIFFNWIKKFVCMFFPFQTVVCFVLFYVV